jgi:hypothetical protein
MPVFAEILQVKGVPKTAGLIKEPAPPLRGPGNKFHVLMAKDNGRGYRKKFLPVFKALSVQGDIFFPVLKGYAHSRIERSIKRHRSGAIPFPVSDQIFVPDSPERRSVRTEIKGFKKIGLSLAVFAYKKNVLSPYINFRINKIAERYGPEKGKAHGKWQI